MSACWSATALAMLLHEVCVLGLLMQESCWVLIAQTSPVVALLGGCQVEQLGLFSACLASKSSTPSPSPSQLSTRPYALGQTRFQALLVQCEDHPGLGSCLTFVQCGHP